MATKVKIIKRNSSDMIEAVEKELNDFIENREIMDIKQVVGNERNYYNNDTDCFIQYLIIYKEEKNEILPDGI